MNIAEWKKPIPKCYVRYDSILEHCASDEIIEMEEDVSGCQGLGMGG